MSMLFGKGDPVVILRRNPLIKRTATPAKRADVQRSYVLPHPTESNTVFIPERFDGGETSKRLRGGHIVDRIDGYRVITTFSWTALTAEQAQRLAKISAYTTQAYSTQGYGIHLRPHRDCQFNYLASLVGAFDWSALVGYKRMTVTLTFQSTDLVREIPTEVGDGTITVKLGVFYQLGGKPA